MSDKEKNLDPKLKKKPITQANDDPPPDPEPDPSGSGSGGSYPDDDKEPSRP